MNVKNSLQIAALRKVYRFIDENPRKNLLKVAEFAEKVVPSGGDYDSIIGGIKKILTAPDSVWPDYILGLWDDIDDGVREAIFENFFLNATFLWSDQLEKNQQKYGCSIPWAILMDPTSACNLHCTGCWAAEYGNRLNLTYEELDRIVRQANEIGTHFFLFTGGEPLVRKQDVIRLCEAHPDSQFLSFTNGTLIDEAFADEMMRVKNFIPAISVEGFESATDFRRGNGTFRKVERAMEILRKKQLPFGISCCYTSQNTEVIGSEEYFDQMIAWGAKFCWFFTYMPVGNGAVPELMATAEQRKFMYEKVREYRRTKPLFTLDFWNDGEYVDGCIAGGRRYLHINANGDYEPCAFIHYSDSNIREKSLLEALQSPLFQAYRRNQPFNENHLRPCPMLDNPDILPRLVKESGAHSTDLESPVNVQDETDKCRTRAAAWAVTADELWIKSGHSCAGCSGCTQL